jgi:hypothetical protein
MAEHRKTDTLMLDVEKMSLVRNGELPFTTKVGRVACVDGTWKAVFLRTKGQGEEKEVLLNADGEVMFNIV